MAFYAFATTEEEDTHEPLTYQEAVACEVSSKWKDAMEEEMDSLRKNKTWELVDHPARQKLVSCKWLFKIKEGIEGVQRPRYKARLVARGFTQREDDMLIAYKSKAEIGSTKTLLKREFDIKELGEAKKILCMKIIRDRSRKILRVSQSWYVSKILNNFRINNRKSVQMPLGGHFKLLLKDCPVRDCDVERMSKVPYANVVGSLMYLMVCTRPDIAYVVLEVKTVEVLKVGTKHNAADALTKVMGYGVVRPTLGGVNSKVLILGVVYFVASEALELVENLGNINDFSGKTKLYLVLPVAFLDSWFILWIFSSFGEASGNPALTNPLLCT
ncbi:retrovirus-related pol polyprotein from transposon TNT 1-94 [Tanacetum coccineum]